MAKRWVCLRPFEYLSIDARGEFHGCCPAWLPDSFGNVLHEEDAKALWNSDMAKAIRASMFDGSFRYCRHDLCPLLTRTKSWQGKVSGLINFALKIRLAKLFREAERGPKTLNLGYDRTCNLACPSCRTDYISATGDALHQAKVIQERVFRAFATTVKTLYITGSGDPFASSLFRSLMHSLSAQGFPQLRKVHLHTNAQLWTPKVWQSFPELKRFVKSAEISIDAATAETYTINRKGGDWETLLANLQFISQLKINTIVSFVVQENNFREIPEFVKLAKRHGFHPKFSRIINWGTFSEQAFNERDVHNPKHPRHSEFQSLLERSGLKRKVFMGNVGAF